MRVYTGTGTKPHHPLRDIIFLDFNSATDIAPFQDDRRCGLELCMVGYINGDKPKEIVK